MIEIYPTYNGSLQFSNFGDRLEYLRLYGKYHVSPRAMSNSFYKSTAWLTCRNDIIRRDAGCDLGIINCDIEKEILVHHICPLTQEDIDNWDVDKLFNPDNLISCSKRTHNRIHYGEPISSFVERQVGDTKLW